jgi:serine/threonine-protein kinase
MSQDYWQRVEEIFHSALERAPDQRKAFLDGACGGDADLRKQVETLLSDHQRVGSFLEGNALKDLTPALEADGSLIGREFGSYRIMSLLGSGGMGTVYQAIDTKFNRSVAVKFLSEDLADAVARRRFQREAQLASSLNHPHILTVYDIGELESHQYLVMEFVDGGTLVDWARSAKRTWVQIVELLTGVADGLAAAHAAGILHRDIKPANILVAKNGYAKLADFGLAKLDEGSQGDETQLTDKRTGAGVVIGTIPYMSPEQASGKPLDSRSDIFSFGTVLYELLAGRKPFAGSTDLEVLQKVIHETAAPLGDDIPPTLRSVVEKALEKDPDRRYQSTRELVIDLRRLARQSGETTAASRRSVSATWLWAATGAVLLTGSIAVWRFWPQPRAAQIRSIAVLPFRNLSGDPNQEFFSDGATEELIANLGQLHAFEKVVSPTSTRRYKGTTKALPEIGRELGVEGIIGGSIERSSNRIRIRAELTQASTNAQLWSREYDRQGGDLLSLEAEVAAAIAQEVRLQITPQESARLTRARRISPAAQDEYLLGHYHASKLGAQDLKEAIAHFDRATQLQPDYAEAWAGLNMEWTTLATFDLSQRQEATRRARDAALKAVAFDPDLAAGHLALGATMRETDREGSLRELHKAAELNHNDGVIELALSVNSRDPAEAVKHAERAAALDPLSGAVQTTAGLQIYGARKYNEAEPYLRRAIELDPQSPYGYFILSGILEMQGKLPEALAADEEGVRLSGPIMKVVPARVYALMGRRKEAYQLIAEAEKLGPKVAYNCAIASSYFALGDKDKGFERLRQAMDKKEACVLNDPRLDGLRSDPRFRTLLAPPAARN